MTSIRCVVRAIGLLLAFVTTQLQANDGGVYKRWAIIASPRVEQDGLADLLTAEFSAQKSLELVERDQLTAATRELEVSAYFGSQDAGRRLQLGRLLNADALLLLSLEGRERPSLKVVISDCRYGARLWIERLPFSLQQLLALTRKIAELVTDTRRRFSGGVEYLVGVPHFVSKNLVHDYDHLQAGYAHLLEAALLKYPGVAVIETEEARAIHTELSLARNGRIKRVVPLLVDAEFQIEKSPRRQPPQSFASFIIVVRGADEFRTIRREKLSLAQVTAFLSLEIPPKLLQWKNEIPGNTFFAREQFGWLVERANLFSQLGYWEEAAGLREAALLLQPDAADQRQELIDDYGRSMRRPINLPNENRRPKDPLWMSEVQRRVDAYLAGLAHVEWLIRNRRIDARKAIELTQQQAAHRLLGPMPFELQSIDGKWWRLGCQQIHLAEEAEERFLSETYPLVLKWPFVETPHQPYVHFVFMERWQQPLVKAALMRVDRTYRTKGDLDYIYDVLTELLPDGLPTDSAIVQAFETGTRYGSFGSDKRKKLPGDAITEKDWLAFLQRLADSDHKTASACGRYGLVQWNSQRRTQFREQPGQLEQLLADVDSLLTDFSQLKYSLPTKKRRSSEWLYGRARNIRFSIDREIKRAAGAVPTKHTRPPRPAGWEKDPKMWKLFGYPETMGRLTFEPVSLKLRQLDGSVANFRLGHRFQSAGGTSPLHNFLRCGKRMDVMWNGTIVVAMVERGVFDVMMHEDVLIDDVAWDGLHLWIGTRKAGVWVIDPATRRVLLKLDEKSGLPPADKRIKLFALGRNRMLAIGSFGEQSRAWYAMIDYRDEAAKINIFHRATHVPRMNSGEAAGADPNTAFEAEWIYQPGLGDPAKRPLLVSRYAKSSEARNRRLVIDPTTLDVHVMPLSNSVFLRGNPKAYYLPNGEVLEPSVFSVKHWARPGDQLSNGKAWRAICTNVTNTGLLSGGILEHDGQLYASGSRWYRIDPKTLKTEMLVPGRLPNEWSMQRFNVSAHYGLIAWGGSHSSASSSASPLYQVTITPNAEPIGKN